MDNTKHFVMSKKLKRIQKVVSYGVVFITSLMVGVAPLGQDYRVAFTIFLAIFGALMLRRAFSDEFWIKLARTAPEPEDLLVEMKEDAVSAMEPARRTRSIGWAGPIGRTNLGILMILSVVYSYGCLADGACRQLSAGDIASLFHVAVFVNYISIAMIIAVSKFRDR